MRPNQRPIVAASMLLGACAPMAGTLAQAPAAQPTPTAVSEVAGTTQPVSAPPIVVRAIKGKVTHRALPDGERVSTKAGDVLSEGMELTTGINSAVELQIGAGQVFTIDRVSRVILREIVALQGKEKTTLAVPYGRVQFQVSTATVANDVQIQAPDSTLAVKGTIGGLEVSPGFPTLAFGGDLNRGVFDVEFERRIIETFRANEKASTKHPKAALYALEEQFVDTGDIWSHEGDERFIIRDFQTNLFLLLEVFIRTQAPTAPLDVYFLDESTLDLYRANIFGTGGLIGSTMGADTNAGTGLALVFLDGQPVLLRLEEDDGAVLRRLDLSDPTRTFEFVSGINSNGPLTGLGALGNRLFTIENDDGDYRIAELVENEGQTFSLFADPVMNLGISLEGDMAGVTSSGTLVVAGRLPTITGFSNGSPGVLGADGVILTVDPRVNYLRGAVSDLTADLSIRPETQVQSGLVINSVDRVTGIAVLSSPAGEPILLVTTRATVNGQPGVTLFNVFRLTPTGGTVLTSVGLAGFTINALASEAPGAVGASPNLAAAPSPSQIDDTASVLFTELAYSQGAVDSGVVERLIANQIVQTAMDAAACAASMELATQLAAAINGHINQRSGAGAAMFDFRAGLPINHPCLPPGTLLSGASSTAFLYFDEFTGDLHSRTLSGIDLVLAPGQGELKPILGAATTPLEGGGRSLFTLVNQRGADGVETPTLHRRDLGANGSIGQDVQVDAFGRRFVDGFIRSFDLAGLAGIGDRLYAGGRTIDDPSGPESGPLEPIVSDATIYEVLTTQGTPIERMVLPFQMQPGALAGAPTRGSIFTLGSLTGDGSFQLAGSASNAVLLEVDPRNNYLVAAHSADDGSFQVRPATSVTGGIDPASLTRVTGMAYVGDTLVMTAQDSTGRQVLVQYLPGATNTPSDPRLRRLNGLSSDIRIGEIGGEVVGPVPGPLVLSPPSGPIDTFTINRTFAMMGYSAQAAGSSALAGMVRDHVAATSVNPAGCRASAELNGPMIPGFLGQHVNQQGGVGQTVFQFRGSLPPNHPCRPPFGPPG